MYNFKEDKKPGLNLSRQIVFLSYNKNDYKYIFQHGKKYYFLFMQCNPLCNVDFFEKYLLKFSYNKRSSKLRAKIY
jgi:hypothetical protein